MAEPGQEPAAGRLVAGELEAPWLSAQDRRVRAGQSPYLKSDLVLMRRIATVVRFLSLSHIICVNLYAWWARLPGEGIETISSYDYVKL